MNQLFSINLSEFIRRINPFEDEQTINAYTLTKEEVKMLEAFKRLTPNDQFYFIGCVQQRAEDFPRTLQ